MEIECLPSLPRTVAMADPASMGKAVAEKEDVATGGQLADSNACHAVGHAIDRHCLGRLGSAVPHVVGSIRDRRSGVGQSRPIATSHQTAKSGCGDSARRLCHRVVGFHAPR